MDETNKNEIFSRLDRIEESINAKLDPLIDLLQTIISTNLKKTVKDENEIPNVQVPNVQVPELMYTTDSENVYISGSKTYDNRELIKSTFRGSSWNKEKSAWTFKKFENYESTLLVVFPNIIKGQ